MSIRDLRGQPTPRGLAGPAARGLHLLLPLVRAAGSPNACVRWPRYTDHPSFTELSD